VDEPVALDLLGIPRPETMTGGELGVGDETVFRGSLLGTSRYNALDLVRNLDLDGLGMYLFLKHGGIQEKVDDHYMVHGGSVKTREDAKKIHLPDPNDPAIYEPYRHFTEQYRNTGLGRFCVMNLGSDPVILGMGFETFATAIYDDRSLVWDLMEMHTDFYCTAARKMSELDFDFLWFGDDLAFKTAPYISPRVFRDLFMPHFRKVADAIAKPWIFHTDGNVMPILDDLLSLGMNGLHPIEPGAMDLEALKKRYGKSLCLCGHISVDTLSRGTPQQVDELVQKAIRTAAPGGGYIAGSSNSVSYYCQAQNVRAMQKAIYQYGKYPISMD